MKILISGGHLTPALALCDYLQTNHPEIEIVFVGREYSQESLLQKSQEKTEIQKRNIPFISFSAPKMGHQSWWEKVSLPIKLWSSLMAAKKILRQEKPKVFVSFGGYLAVPIAIASWWLQVPIITHEQTRSPGFANKIIGYFASEVAVSFKETVAHFDAHKTRVIGNPIRPQLLSIYTRKPEWMMESEKPLLYITGGNQGSEVINHTIAEALPQLVKEWFVIHQCGNPTSRHHYKQELETVRKTLPSADQNQYVIREWISTEELGWIYRHATLVISRAGANTVVELATLAIPSLLIPLPHAHHQEQLVNAQWLAEHGGAQIIEQTDFTAHALLTTLTQLKPQLASMETKLHSLRMPVDADQRLFELIQKYS